MCRGTKFCRFEFDMCIYRMRADPMLARYVGVRQDDPTIYLNKYFFNNKEIYNETYPM